MEQERFTAAEALDVFDAVMSSLRSDDRTLLSAQERVVLMQRVRRFPGPRHLLGLCPH